MAGKSDVEAVAAFVRLFLKDQLTKDLVRTMRNAGQSMQNMGRSMQAVGKTMAVAAAAMLIPVALSVKTFADFQDQMLTVKAVTTATGAEFDILNSKAKELGRTTSYTASEVAGAMVELGRAGFKTTEIDASIASMLNLARATGTELPRAAEIAAGTLRAFSLDAAEMTRVADVGTATANSSAQTFEEYGEAMVYAAKVSKDFGLSIEDASKAVGVLANVNIKGSQAGTSMRKILLSLADPAIQGKLRAALVEPIDAATGQFRDFGDIMIDIGKAMASMPQPKRIAWIQDLFQIRAVGAGLTLTTEQFEGLSNAVDAASGAAKLAADIMDSGLGGALRRLWSATEGIRISIGEQLAPTLKAFADYLSNVSLIVVKFISDNESIVPVIAAMAAGLGAAGIAVTAFGAAVALAGTAVLTINAIGSAVVFLATPLGAATIAATALGGALALLAGNTFWQMVKDGTFDDTARQLKEIGSGFTAAFQGVTDALKIEDVKVAMEIFSAEVEIAWLKLMDSLYKHWIDFQRRMITAGKRKIIEFYGKFIPKPLRGLAGEEAPKETPEPLAVKIARLEREQAARLSQIKQRAEEKAKAEAAAKPTAEPRAPALAPAMPDETPTRTRQAAALREMTDQLQGGMSGLFGRGIAGLASSAGALDQKVGETINQARQTLQASHRDGLLSGFGGAVREQGKQKRDGAGFGLSSITPQITATTNAASAIAMGAMGTVGPTQIAPQEKVATEVQKLNAKVDDFAADAKEMKNTVSKLVLSMRYG